ncbi:hypothetical protein [Halomicrococcus sp. SG-WS-1]|uniref:hypothetical protein n=1 Tax=Halomicrococcus sp. SG-WS-1 TaxID=3439057 RepID=UPI003F7A2DC3
MILDVFLPAIFGLVGLVGVVGLLSFLSSLQTVLSTGVSPPDALGTGRVAVIGEVEATDSPVRAPLSGEECVGYVLDREVKHRTGGTGVGLLVPRWHRKDVHYELPPTYLADVEGDRVRVQFDADVESWRTPVPDELFSNVQLGVDDRTRYDEDASPPEAVHGILGDVPDVSSAGSVFGVGSHPHRYTEWRLEPGDRLYLLGHAHDDASEPTIRARIDEDVLVDLGANSRLRLLGLLTARFLATGALAAFGLGGAIVLV